MPFKMSSVPTRSTARPVSSAASLVLHGGFVLMGIVTTLLGPMLPILIGRWTLSDQRAGLFFSAQFCGSMLGVSSLGPLLRRGYRHTLVCGFSLIAAGVAGLNLVATSRAWRPLFCSVVDWGRLFRAPTCGWQKLQDPTEWPPSAS